MSKKAVILAGGLGHRLLPFTTTIPKPLLPIGEKAVLEIQIEHLKEHEFNEIYLATNYKSEYIEGFFGDGSRYGVKLSVSKEEIPLGTAGPIKLIKDKLTDPFIVMNGDILSRMNFSKFYSFALDHDCLLTVAIKKIITPYAFGNIHFDGDYVTAIEEKPDMITYVLAGIYMMNPEIFDLIPDKKYFGMDLLIKSMLDKKLPIAKYDMQEYWIDIGRIDDYGKAQDAYEAHFKETDN